MNIAEALRASKESGGDSYSRVSGGGWIAWCEDTHPDWEYKLSFEELTADDWERLGQRDARKKSEGVVIDERAEQEAVRALANSPVPGFKDVFNEFTIDEETKARMRELELPPTTRGFVPGTSNDASPAIGWPAPPEGWRYETDEEFRARCLRGDFRTPGPGKR